jgi:hypothetical protein
MKTSLSIKYFLLFILNYGSVMELSARDSINYADSSTQTSSKKIKSFEKTLVVNAKPEEIFAFMDDINNTGMHMTKSNAAMAGGKLTVEWLTPHKTGPGSKYRWTGRAFGMKMDFSVEVTKWIEGKEKIWGTFGDAKMIVLSWYEMYLTLTPLPEGKTQIVLGILYTKAKGSIWALLFAKRYAKWCVKSMLRTTENNFEEK